MSDQTARPPADHRRQPARSFRGLLAVVAILVLAACGCTDGSDDEVESAEPTVAADPTSSTSPEPDEPEQDPPDPQATPPAPRPRPGPVVLVHLEGPVTDAQATDVVVRNERGSELDRFRLPGAVEVHTGPGARWALIPTNTGQWARYDAVSGELSLVTFEQDPPTGVPTIQGAAAWWDEPEQPWLVRLDTGHARSLRSQLGETGRVVAATPDGSHLLIRNDRDHLLDTEDGTTRTLPAQSSVTVSSDGSAIASTAPATAGADVYLEGIDGSDRRLLATVPVTGVPVPLADGRVLVLGASSQIVQAGGTLTELPSLPGAADPVVAADGRRVMVTTEAGLVLVDPDAGTAVTVPDSRGWTVLSDGPRTVLWAASSDPEDPGVVVVDPDTGVALPMLADTPTGPFTAVSDDGRTVILQVGADGADQAVLTADGEVRTAMGAVDGALHPDATIVALGVVAEATRSLVIGDLSAVQDYGRARLEVPTGRNPVWLLTDEPGATR